MSLISKTSQFLPGRNMPSFYCILFILSHFFGGSLMSQTTKTATTGNWNTPGTWTPSGVPASNDPVIIPNGVTLTGDVTTTCASITFTGASATLSVNSGITITVSSDIILNTGINNATACTLRGAGSITCGSITVGSAVSPNGNFAPVMTSTISNLTINGAGNLTLFARQSGSNYSNPIFNLNSGTLTVPGQIFPNNVQNNTKSEVSFRMNQGSQNGILVLSNASPFGTCANCIGTGNGKFNITLNGTASTVIYNAAVSQTVLATNYFNLTLAGSGTKTTSSVDVGGKLSMQGTASASDPITFGATSTLEYKGSVPQTTSNNEFPNGGPLNLIIDNPNGVTLHAPRTLRSGTNSIRLISGTLTNTNNITLTSGATIIRSGGSFSQVPLFGTNVNVTYNQHTNSITCGPELPTNTVTLNNLTINNTNGVLFDRNITVNGSLALNNGILSIDPSDTLYIFSGNQIIGSFGNQTHIYTKSDAITGNIGYIRSKVVGTSIFPLGDGTNYLPATLSLSSVGLNEFNLAVFKTATINGQPNGTPFSNISPIVNAIWLINRSSGNVATDITLSWKSILEGADFSDALDNQIGISRYDGTGWDPITGIDGDNFANVVTRPDINNFSPFLVAILGTPLPLKFGNLSAARNGQSVNLKWEAFSEDNVAFYEVQKSNTGASFSKAGVVNAMGNNTSLYKYSWIDAAPGNGTVFYRIKAVDNDGKYKYSSIVKVSPENGNSGLNIYPNPMQVNGRFNIEAGSLPRGTYNVELIDMSGVRSFNRVLEHAGGSLTQNIELSQSLRPGTYVMKFSGENISYTATVIIK